MFRMISSQLVIQNNSLNILTVVISHVDQMDNILDFAIAIGNAFCISLKYRLYFDEFPQWAFL